MIKIINNTITGIPNQIDILLQALMKILPKRYIPNCKLDVHIAPDGIDKVLNYRFWIEDTLLKDPELNVVRYSRLLIRKEDTMEQILKYTSDFINNILSALFLTEYGSDYNIYNITEYIDNKVNLDIQ